MKMRNTFIAAFASASLFGSVAQAETYICQIRPDGPSAGLVSNTITVNIDDVTNDVMVSDAIILATKGKAIAATLVAYTPKRLSLKWALQGAKSSRPEPFERVNYRLMIWKTQGNRASVVANYPPSVGASLRMPKEVNGSGRCKLR